MSSAQVARAGRPPPSSRARSCLSPNLRRSLSMVVLSPPGRTMPSRPASSSALRTGNASAPRRVSAWLCSRKAPGRPRTPVLGALTGAGRRGELPTARGEQLLLEDAADLQALHGRAQSLADLEDLLRLVEVGGGGDDRPGHLERLFGLENARANEIAVTAELHHQGRVSGRSDAAGGEVHHGQPPQPCGLGHQLVWSLEVPGTGVKLLFGHPVETADLAADGAHVPHRLHHVAGAGFAFGADHRGPLIDAPQRLAEVARAANKWDFELPLVYVVFLVSRSQDLGFIDEIDADGLQQLRLDEMPDTALRHHRDRHRVLDLGDQLRIAHTGDAAVPADVGGHTL